MNHPPTPPPHAKRKQREHLTHVTRRSYHLRTPWGSSTPRGKVSLLRARRYSCLEKRLKIKGVLQMTDSELQKAQRKGFSDHRGVKIGIRQER